MITVTAAEYHQLLESAEDKFKNTTYRIDQSLKAGKGVSKSAKVLKIMLCALMALRGYQTGKFESAEYFNVIDADDVSNIFNLFNSCNDGR
ncbi:hypothetical protein [Sphingobacterium detergens]|uniref:hypothetical protein n=1 Tax=Sphingobacterium detergens TaxID=1145106 RepID=UPI003AAE52AE